MESKKVQVPESKGLFKRDVYKQSLRLAEQFKPQGSYSVRPSVTGKSQPDDRKVAAAEQPTGR